MLEPAQNDSQQTIKSQISDIKLLSDRQKIILIIDDDQDFRLLLSELLVGEGYRVTTARDGDLALSKLGYIKPDLVILDLSLPGMSGLELKKKLSRSSELSTIPVLFLTGQGIVEGENCLLKPYDERELLSSIRHLIISS